MDAQRTWRYHRVKDSTRDDLCSVKSMQQLTPRRRCCNHKIKVLSVWETVESHKAAPLPHVESLTGCTQGSLLLCPNEDNALPVQNNYVHIYRVVVIGRVSEDIPHCQPQSQSTAGSCSRSLAKLARRNQMLLSSAWAASHVADPR